MQSFYRFIPAIFLLILAACQSQESSKEEANLREQSKGYIQAYNNHDAGELSQYWAEDAILVDPRTGATIKGREAIKDRFEQIFEGTDETGYPKLEFKSTSLAFQGKNKAIENGTAVVTNPDGSIEETSFRVIFEKKDSKWLISQASEVDMEEAPSHYEDLKELSWLTGGKWIDEDEDTTIEQNYEWDKNKNFIIHKFAVNVHNALDLEGQQIIGWDPNTNQIRSWIFDSDGGFGEGKWQIKGDKIIVENSFILPDGGKSSATNIYNKINENTFTWESTDRELDGEFLPNVEPIKVTRKKG